MERVFILKITDFDHDYYEVFEERGELLRYFRQNLMDCMKDGVDALVKQLDEQEMAEDGDGMTYTLIEGYINRKQKEA